MIVQSGRIRNHQYTPAIGALTLCLAVAAGPALAQAPDASRFPAKPVRLVVPAAPGGNPDVLARMLTQKLQTALGASMVVDNQPGAGGISAAINIAKSSPDGYTLCLISASHAVNSATHPKRLNPFHHF